MGLTDTLSADMSKKQRDLRAAVATIIWAGNDWMSLPASINHMADGEERRSETISLRFFDVQPELVSRLQQRIPHGRWHSKRLAGKNRWVIALELDFRSNYDSLCDFVLAEALPASCYGIWVSLETDRDNDGIHVPENILDLYKKIGGNFDFSFVCTAPEEQLSVRRSRR